MKKMLLIIAMVFAIYGCDDSSDTWSLDGFELDLNRASSSGSAMIEVVSPYALQECSITSSDGTSFAKTYQAADFTAANNSYTLNVPYTYAYVAGGAGILLIDTTNFPLNMDTCDAYGECEVPIITTCTFDNGRVLMDVEEIEFLD